MNYCRDMSALMTGNGLKRDVSNYCAALSAAEIDTTELRAYGLILDINHEEPSKQAWDHLMKSFSA